MKIEILAATAVTRELLDGPMEPYLGANSAATLTEFAGRSCYQSWSRPNPKTATPEGYAEHIIDVGHFSVFEHATVTLRYREVSRALTHELVRHRHFSFSQLSQRYCKLDGDPVIPPLFREDEQARGLLILAWKAAVEVYEELVERAVAAGAARKQAREAARAVLPNMTPTEIIVTGNHRAWREFVQKRATIHADAEIRAAAVETFVRLREVAPELYQDARLDVQQDASDQDVQVVAWS